jgi:hypothetical protein
MEEMALPGSKPLENMKWEMFAQARSKGASQKACAMTAGYSEKSASVTGNKLDRMPQIRQRVKFLQGNGILTSKDLEAARIAFIEEGGPDMISGVTAKWLAMEFFKNCQIARSKGNLRDANHALVYISKLHQKMDSIIPFPPGSPHPDENPERDRIDANTNDPGSIQKGAEIAERLGQSLIDREEAEDVPEIVSPSDADKTDGDK